MRRTPLLVLSVMLFLQHQIIGQEADLIIKNVQIIDGSGSPAYKGSIAIDRGAIYQIGDLEGIKANKVINGDGLVAAPGFIDVHAHVEGSILNRPLAANFIKDGVTTLVTGNCGSSRTDLSTFFNEVKNARPAINIASLIGHNSVRRAVMGEDDRDPTVEELSQMKDLVSKGMKAGAVGFSTGLIYVPGTYSKTDEVISLAQSAADQGGIYASHIRNEGNHIREAIDEAVQVGIAAEMPVEVSHFKISSKVLWGESDMTTGMIQSYRDQGVDVLVDQYPYPASSTTLAVLLPTWALAGGNDSLNFRLNDPTTKQLIIKEMKEELKANGLDDYSYCAVSNCPWNQEYNGLRINQISELRHNSQKLDDQIETVLEMVRKGDRVQMVFHKMSEDDVKTIMQFEHTMIASDAGIPDFGKRVPHPRAYGTNSRVLGKYVREEGIISLEEAVKKMTSMPAKHFKLKNRGLLKKGYSADIVLFDPQKVGDRATFERPHAYPDGIPYVIVNGEVTIKQGRQLAMRNGEVIRLN